MNILRFALSVAGALCAAAAPAVAMTLTPEDRANLHWIAQEVEIAHALDALATHSASGFLMVRDVTVVDVAQGQTLAHESVLVREGKIVWVGDAGAVPNSSGAFVIDGTGLFLAPGLTDMHVHTVSLAEQLLRLATGNTSVRDMDGFPWMLQLRRAIEGGRILAPTEYVAGTIIASYPLDGYAVVVKDEDEARRTVRDQVACGYDFIKVHNILKPKLFDAVADEAHIAGLDLVGHIPHDITIDHAIHAGHMRSLEHLKGFINDRTLLVSDEDYATALSGADVWLTPTFYALNGFTRMTQAESLLRSAQMRYVPLHKRVEWQAPISAGDLHSKALFDVAVPAAMQRLLPLHPHWLAGTDAANYPLQVAGFALLDELTMMVEAGIAPADALRAATSEPAEAMHKGREFGQVKRGMRADLLLLTSDPTRNLNAFRDNRGLILRGHFLNRTSLDEALGRLARIEAKPDAGFRVDARTVQTLAREVSSLGARDVALDAMHLAPAIATLKRLGYVAAAATLESIVSTPSTGPCMEFMAAGGG
jgi:hypothetical protein